MGKKRKWSSGPGQESLKSLQLSVQKFVEDAGAGSGERRGPQGQGAARKAAWNAINRKDRRKQERLTKKMKRKAFYERKPPEPQAGSKHSQTPAKKPGHGEQSSHTQKKQGPQQKGPAIEKQQGPQKKGPVIEKQQGPQKKGPVIEKQQGPQKKKNKLSSEELRKKALLEANEREDREIRRLEKSLKMNKRKNKSSLPQSFTFDGLDYILGVLEPGGAAIGLDEEEELNTADRLKKLSDNVEDEDGSDEEGEEDGSDEEKEMEENDDDVESEEVVSDEGETMEQELMDSGEEEEEEEEDDEDDNQTEEAPQDEDVDEPVTDTKTTQDIGKKYIPPHIRQSSDTESAKKREELERLWRSVKGLINRLSEPNMAYISGQLEELYMTNSRKDMNDTLSNVVLSACITAALMPDRLMMEHVLLISILHHSVGIEVGAHILETVVKQFSDQHEDDTDSKECDNLITFIGHMYNFHVIDSRVVFDILKMLVSKFTERNIELLLLLLKNVGFSLRKDDALALKELICEAQTKASTVDKTLQDQSRVRFMLEIMMALKNNDMRKIPGYDPEPVERLRKLQRSMVRNSVSGSDTRLRVSLQNILEAEKVGRWWIVGSSWSGAPMIGQSSEKALPQAMGKVSAKIMDLARKQRMNTDIRRNIFCIIMTSEDYLDAFEKLVKLGLKDHQEREIVHVLIDCCLQEKIYNPFYAFLSSKFCEYHRRFQMTFQFSMWDKFRDLESLSPTTFSNLTLFLSHLLKSKSLSLSVFKVIEFSELDKIRVSFLRQVLYKMLMDSEADDIAVIFGKISDNQKLGMLREGLKLFISHFLLKNIRAQKTPEEAQEFTQKADLAIIALQAKEGRLRL
ncbi:hypothetical protein GDO81_012402 [Engystomops pustulosus]|uniref:Nucleolar MIF4G domain-containing protein 1 n=1 Tax=Engystomops pustulosus TaxID=76066 RepID=A0AAV7BLM8_ENGPU|nr:hypothetical protein GDO81_012402 [Engystomops pustulosus]